MAGVKEAAVEEALVVSVGGVHGEAEGGEGACRWRINMQLHDYKLIDIYRRIV